MSFVSDHRSSGCSSLIAAFIMLACISNICSVVTCVGIFMLFVLLSSVLVGGWCFSSAFRSPRWSPDGAVVVDSFHLR